MVSPTLTVAVSTKAAVGAVATALVVCVAGCGPATAHPRANNPTAADTAGAEQLIAQAFGPNPAAGSGLLDGEIVVQVSGVPRFVEPVSLTMTGPFSQARPGAAPAAHLSLRVTVPKGLIGGDVTFTANKVLFSVGSTTYRIPAPVAASIRRPLRGARNALTAVLGVFGVAPQRWGTKPRVVGQEKLDGTTVVHLTDRLNASHFFLDAARYAMLLTAFRATDLALLPHKLTPAIRRALVRSVTAARGDLYIGSADHVVRQAHLAIELKPSPADRALLGGIAGLQIRGNLHVTDVGSRPAISVPTTLRPYAELKVLLDNLTVSVRQLARQGKY